MEIALAYKFQLGLISYSWRLEGNNMLRYI